MTPEQLKASILQMAIQGKLVEQRPEEGTAEDLYDQIQAEKQKLIKEGKIKKEKPLAEITEGEVPFDIPESWRWVRLRDICTKIVDGDHNPPAGHNQPTEYLMLSATNINQNKIVELDKVRYVTKEVFEVENQRTNVEINDIFFTIVGSMGRSCVYKGGLNICFQRSVSVLSTLIYPEYLKYLLDTPYIQDFMYRNATGTAQKGFYLKQVENLVVALPPFEEQHRIVAKIEELLPYVDRYAEAYEKLEQFNAKFPEDMKKSILQYAIQGKLVEQRPEEGTAEELYQQIQEEKQKLITEGKIRKEKPLAEIAEDEIPFDIPESWKWCRLSEVIDVRDGTHDSPKYVPKGVPLVTSKNLSGGTIDYGNIKYITQADADKINERSAVNDGDILFAMIGSIGNPVLVKKDREFCIKNMALFKKYTDTNIDMNYMYWFFYFAQYGLKAEASGGVQSFISLTRFREYLFPLPPYEEQKRIAKRLEEVLPLCERLSGEGMS